MKIFSFLIFSLVLFTFASADFTSTNFQLENPINIIQGGQSSSSNFQYLSSTGQLISGQSTSSTFAQNAGFLYFPTATSPVVSATPGDAQVILNWTSATGIFANITNYDVGISTTSGSGFTYVSIGDVLTSTRTSLSNGTTYFFKVRSYAAGLLLSESAEVNATPVASSPPPPPPPPPAPSGGGGGGGAGFTSTTGVTFSGRAYPLSKVSILKDGQLALSTIAGPDANFSAFLGNLSSGNYIFSVLGTDNQDNESTLFTFPIFITEGVTTSISGLFLTPTIAVDKSEVKAGENITIFGQSSPSSEIVITINSEQQFIGKTETDKNGVYLFNFDTTPLELGQHFTKSKAAFNGEITNFSKTAVFLVGNETILRKTGLTPKKGDINGDGRVNLIDFSIVAYWYGRLSSPANVDLSGDGKIDLVDFSIMAFYWTG